MPRRNRSPKEELTMLLTQHEKFLDRNEKLELENYALLNEIEDMKEVYIIQQETINDQETKIEDLDVEVKNLQVNCCNN
ncbi:hypothetical protein C2G38_2199473 [Gigaspora rosea]|uniref:Uncharacterized protein n=1 Tax=Gigaspora rosea TaxID=44941 RepID=A0A397URN6_9GLOM|nr:hypothetical protein C2G38_2199473 [Gigaspora rosea]